MLKKSITYTDFNEVVRTEDFYFNLTKADIATLELQEKEGFTEMLRKIAQSDDRRRMIAIMKDIIRMSYGIKSDDGRKHMKSDAISEDFMATNAFSELFVELCTDADKNVEFVLGIIPSEFRGQINEGDIKKAVEEVQLPQPAVPAWKAEGRLPTEAELVSMPREELVEAMKAKSEAMMQKQVDA